MSDGFRVVLTTVPDIETGRELGRTLVDERLAACANIVPGVVSVFRWEGAVQSEPEVLLILKTTSAAVRDLVERAGALHPYDVPEVLALPVEEGLDGYLDWVRAEVEGAREGG